MDDDYPHPYCAMLLVVCGITGVSAASLPAAQQPVAISKSKSALQAVTLAFIGVTVVDVTDGRLFPGQKVIVVGNRVQAVGPVDSIHTPQGARVIEAFGKYLIPGLWDMHIHPLHYPDVFYPLLIANGVTGIRDAGTHVPIDKVLQWRQEIIAGTLVGPRVIISGPSLGAMHKGPYNTPAKARHIVDSLKAAGSNMIKISNVSTEEYFYLAAAARQAELPFGGHIPGGRSKVFPLPVPVTQAADSGVAIIDHNDGMQGACMGDSAGNAARLDICIPIARHLRRTSVWIVPTFNFLWTSVHSALLSKTAPRMKGFMTDNYRLVRPSTASTTPVLTAVPVWADMDVMDSADVPILSGSDAAAPISRLVPGYSLHAELAALVWAGLKPLTALQAATLNPAKALRATDSLGTIAPGKLADLVLLDGNPLLDIHNTTKIQAVVANGRYFDRAALDGLIMEAERGSGPRQ